MGGTFQFVNDVPDQDEENNENNHQSGDHGCLVGQWAGAIDLHGKVDAPGPTSLGQMGLVSLGRQSI